MNKINLLIVPTVAENAERKEKIKNAVSEAERYAFSKLNIDWDIDLLVTDKLRGMVIPEDGVGGRARASDYIELAVNNENSTEGAVAEMTVHELCHAARWGKNDEWATTLFDAIICEGIATYFEAEFAKDKKRQMFFLKTVVERENRENKKILEKLQSKLDSSKCSSDEVFFGGNDSMPRWAGYSLGYYLVKKYLEKTGKTIGDAFADKYADFWKVLK